jgi:hypothetical protein
MIKIINGKKYDTATATKLVYWNNGHYPNDFHFISERLYQKKNGEFFLYVEGGAATKYSQNCCGGGTCSGEDIFPLSIDEAKTWVERKESESYEDIFGEVEE